jgi:hypothetical protein
MSYNIAKDVFANHMYVIHGVKNDNLSEIVENYELRQNEFQK